jgi:hypothetical protein
MVKTALVDKFDAGLPVPPPESAVICNSGVFKKY